MQLETLSYHTSAGWSVSSFPALDSERTLVLIFAAPGLVRHPEALAALVAAYPRSCVLGCSTAGEIGGPMLHGDSLSAAVVRLGSGTLRQVQLRPGRSPLIAAALTIAQELAAPDLRGVLVLADGPPGECEALISGLAAALPRVPLAGALAADGEQEDRGWIILRAPGGRPHADDPQPRGPGRRGLVSAVGLYGGALRITGAIAAAANHAEALVKGAREAAAALPSPPGPRLVLAFGSVSRRLLLGQQAEQELEAIRGARPGPGTTALVGCYSHGQIGGDPAELRSRILSLLSLSEE